MSRRRRVHSSHQTALWGVVAAISAVSACATGGDDRVAATTAAAAITEEWQVLPPAPGFSDEVARSVFSIDDGSIIMLGGARHADRTWTPTRSAARLRPDGGWDRLPAVPGDGAIVNGQGSLVGDVLVVVGRECPLQQGQEFVYCTTPRRTVIWTLDPGADDWERHEAPDDLLAGIDFSDHDVSVTPTGGLELILHGSSADSLVVSFDVSDPNSSGSLVGSWRSFEISAVDWSWQEISTPPGLARASLAFGRVSCETRRGVYAVGMAVDRSGSLPSVSSVSSVTVFIWSTEAHRWVPTTEVPTTETANGANVACGDEAVFVDLATPAGEVWDVSAPTPRRLPPFDLGAGLEQRLAVVGDRPVVGLRGDVRLELLVYEGGRWTDLPTLAHSSPTPVPVVTGGDGLVVDVSAFVSVAGARRYRSAYALRAPTVGG